MRKMQSDDLGDIRVFEDDAIREQAARLQVHVQNLGARLCKNATISIATEYRIARLFEAMRIVSQDAWKLYKDSR